MSAMKTSIDEAVSLLANTEALLVVTGAGISAESGLPTFRGDHGLYKQWPDLASVLSAEGLAQDPNAVWDFINTFRIQAAAAPPNEAHRVLAQWERTGRFQRFLIATQNIDGLHQVAGNQRVSELHGSVWQMACPRESDNATDDAFAGEFQEVLVGCDAEAVSPAVTLPKSAGLVLELSEDTTCPRATKASSMLHTVISAKVFFIICSFHFSFSRRRRVEIFVLRLLSSCS
jgi:NAD-dependent SIR2 family protein deacetylase